MSREHIQRRGSGLRKWLPPSPLPRPRNLSSDRFFRRSQPWHFRRRNVILRQPRRPPREPPCDPAGLGEGLQNNVKNFDGPARGADYNEGTWVRAYAARTD